jgi:hypothetical protein
MLGGEVAETFFLFILLKQSLKTTCYVFFEGVLGVQLWLRSGIIRYFVIAF